MGLEPVAAAASVMRVTQLSAFSTLSTKGMVTWSKRMPSNWVSRLWPSISAVMPVPSDTMKMVRCWSDMAIPGRPASGPCNT